jgi:hypothetical protein
MATIKWYGDEVRAKVAAAAAVGVDVTNEKAAEKAEANHPEYPPASQPYERYADRTGDESRSIAVFTEAVEEDDRVHGQWGATAKQSLFLEIGTSMAGPTAVEREQMGGGDMDAIPDPVGPKMAPRPFLRPAADEEYPLLGVRIGAAFRGESMP